MSPDCNGGWSLWWGWFLLERLVFDPQDDWGEEAAENQDAVFSWLFEELKKDEKGEYDVPSG